MKTCSKCGDIVEENEKFCNICGTPIICENSKNINQIELKNESNIFNDGLYKNNDIKKIIVIVSSIIFYFFMAILVISFFISKINIDYYFNTNYNDNNEIVTEKDAETENVKKSKYSTVIIYDNTYDGVSINTVEDANKLIIKDSTNQKSSCPKEILDIENSIISKYSITAVNLCELDLDFSKELEKVIKNIYDEYPGARGNITNISLVNATMSQGYIAAFMPAFQFASSNSKDSYPYVMKTQILLNTKYFLNKDRLEQSVIEASKAGHFPPNSNIYSPLAHEFGHYLSFLAMMKYYKTNSILLLDDDNINNFYKIITDFNEGNFSLLMITEAYNNFKNDSNTNLNIEEFRGTISQYSLAKNNNGEYIYDETIAEAFHDVYLNKDSAKDASKYIVKVLKNRLGN